MVPGVLFPGGPIRAESIMGRETLARPVAGCDGAHSAVRMDGLLAEGTRQLSFL